MAENSTDLSGSPDHSTIQLKAKLTNLQDPLDLQLLENLSIFFGLKDVDPTPIVQLYKECITLLGKDWEPFIRTLSSKLTMGVVACEHLMIGYSECLKVIEARDGTMAGEKAKEQEYWMQQAEEQARQINLLSIKLSSMPSSSVSDVSTYSSLSSSLSLVSMNQFIWEDGKSYRSNVGIVTANRDGSIAINLAALEFQSINTLRTIIMLPENWEFILNRDLNGLNSYLSLKSKQFKGFNNKDISEKANILKDLASHVPINKHQWINASGIINDRPRCLLPFKVKIDFDFKVKGPLPSCNLKEFKEIISLLVILDTERSLNVSKLAKPFLWMFICMILNTHINDLNKDVLNKVSFKEAYNGMSEGLCEENSIETQSVIGDRTWQLTDNCDTYVTVLCCYKLEYSTFHMSNQKSIEDTSKVRFHKITAPTAKFRARLLELETQLINVKTTADQSEFLNRLLYKKRDESKVALIPMDFELSKEKA